jgi:Flp pilus assembly pilin Flp
MSCESWGASQMKTVIQILRTKLGVTWIEYLIIGYFVSIFVMIDAKVIGLKLNTNFFAPSANAVEGHSGNIAAPRVDEARRSISQ